MDLNKLDQFWISLFEIMQKSKDKPPYIYIDYIKSLNLPHLPSQRSFYRHINTIEIYLSEGKIQNKYEFLKYIESKKNQSRKFITLEKQEQIIEYFDQNHLQKGKLKRKDFLKILKEKFKMNLKPTQKNSIFKYFACCYDHKKQPSRSKNLTKSSKNKNNDIKEQPDNNFQPIIEPPLINPQNPPTLIQSNSFYLDQSINNKYYGMDMDEILPPLQEKSDFMNYSIF